MTAAVVGGGVGARRGEARAGKPLLIGKAITRYNYL